MTMDPAHPDDRRVLRVLIRRGADASWHAHALECDVTAIGANRWTALDTLVKVIDVHLAHDTRRGRHPLSSFAAAPDRYWAEFHRASKLATPVELSRDGRPPIPYFLVANAIEDK